MSGILQTFFQNIRSFGKGGWAISLSGATNAQALQRNSIFATSTNLYIGAKFSNTGTNPSAVCSVSIAAPSLVWSTYLNRSGAAAGSTAMYASGSFVYGLLVDGGNIPYFIQYNLSTGSLVAQKLLSGFTATVQAADIAQDSSNNLFFSFRTFTGSTGADTSITKVDSALAMQWGFSFRNATDYGKSGFGSSQIYKLFTDSSNNIYGGGSLSSSSSANPTGIAGIIKLNSAGTTLWQRVYGDNTVGSLQFGFQGAWLNGAGNVMVAFGGDAADALYFAEVSPSTGVYTGSYKQKLTFTGNVGAYKNSQNIVKADAAGNVWVFMQNNSTSMWLAKINAALTTVTAIKITSTYTFQTRGFFVDETNVYFSVSEGVGTFRKNIFKLPVDIAPFVGSTVTTNLGTYTFSAATGTLASHTVTAGSACTNTKSTTMNSYGSAVLSSNPQTNTLTTYTF